MLVGISGKIKSGKNTFAELLTKVIYEQLPRMRMQEIIASKDHPDRIHHKSFADPIREILSILTGCDTRQLHDQEFKASEMPVVWGTTDKPPMTYRQALQKIGTDLFRDQFHNNTWVNALFSTWQPLFTRGRHSDTYPSWIITDVRFPNEAKAIKDRGGILIRLNRWPDYVYLHRYPDIPPDRTKFDPDNISHMNLWKGEQINSHPSETSLDNYDGFDAVVDNNGTLEELLIKAREIVNKFNLK